MRYRATIFRLIISLLLFAAGLCTVGYAVWKSLEALTDGQTGKYKEAAAELDRLKALGVKVGQLPGFPIQKLDFSESPICDDDLDVLANLPDIDQIDLSDTPITDRGLVHLRHMPQLQVLRLNNTKITDEGLTNIENSPKLTILHLAHTGANLTTVKLNTLPALRIIDARYSPVGDSALANICQATGLTGLGLPHTKIGDSELAHLKQLTRLEVLDLGGTAVSDRGVAILRSIDLPALRALIISECVFTTNGLRELSGLHIKHLNLSGAKLPFPQAVTILGKCRSLVELVIDRTAVRDEDLKCLVQDFPQLTLFQACQTALSDAGLQAIGEHPNLKLLVLRDTAITADAVNRFQLAHPRIEILYGKQVKD